MSSKIPQAEWEAIAARRDKGESVAYIARTYETSPATIYGVLKKLAESKGEPAPVAEAAAPVAEAAVEVPPAPVVVPEPVAQTSASAPAPIQTRLTLTASRPPAPQPAPVAAPVPPASVAVAPAPVEAAPAPAQPSAPQQPFKFTYENRAVDPPVRQPRVPAPPRPFADVEPKTALNANLDAELRAQSDAAILAFQTAFAAVLADETAPTRKELRQASSDLMRVAARTTIALERKDAIADRASMPPMQRPRNDPPVEPGEFRQNRRPPRG